MRGRVIRRLSHFSLRARILILLLGLQVLAIVIVGLVASQSVQEALLAHAQTEIEQTRKLLNAALGPQLAERDFGAAHELFEQLGSDRHLSYFVVQDRDGKVFAQKSPPPEGLPVLTQNNEVLATGNLLHAQTRLTVNGIDYGRLRFGV